MNLLNECTLGKVEKKNKNFRRSTTLRVSASCYELFTDKSDLFTDASDWLRVGDP